ncbi:hypothetical protein TNCV_1208611 [Trichonephila clavipes]|nr:hypothetical protein TNCV_1208611 [Trichonephila clavipes]
MSLGIYLAKRDSVHIIGVNISCGNSSPLWKARNLIGFWYVERGSGKLGAWSWRQNGGEKLKRLYLSGSKPGL